MCLEVLEISLKTVQDDNGNGDESVSATLLNNLTEEIADCCLTPYAKVSAQSNVTRSSLIAALVLEIAPQMCVTTMIMAPGTKHAFEPRQIDEMNQILIKQQ